MGWINLREFGVKDSVILKFMKEFKTFETLIKDENLRILNRDIRAKVLQAALYDNRKLYDKLNKNNIQLLEYTDDKYPESLKNIQDPPLFLYVAGEIKFSERNIAVVGTRRNTIYGKVSCESILKELLEYDIDVVSGLALGIDNIAHEYTLKKNGRCIGVVGSGLDRIFPYESRKLWEKIPENGMLISEYPLGSEPLKWNFPRRNRIIAGLSQGILLCESYEKGGALITAELGFQYNREIFAVPGFINYPSFKGCNKLIRDTKAKLILSGKDIADEFIWGKRSKEELNTNLTSEEKTVLSFLNTEKNLDELILETGFSAGIVLAVLANLEVKDFIFEISGGKYKGK
jgi:DNA processing protein